MSKNTIREDKTCLNCYHVVEKRFCPNCGQENVETRKTFHHLFVHFFEDLTHYENSFWKTIRNLILKPASLTKEYLSGKRMSYLAPIRLYIFISFVTFFLIAITPKNDIDKTKNTSNEKEIEKTEKLNEEKIINELIEKEKLSKTEIDSLKDIIKNKNSTKFLNFGYDSVEKMDSIKRVNPDEILDFEYWINKKTIEINKNNTNEEINEKLPEIMIRNIPKVLFIYMPIFALLLWLFNNKKKWYYFDHGIFTLHYFSFLLLATLILGLKRYFLTFFGDYSIILFLNKTTNIIGVLYIFYYFFAAYYKFYLDSKLKSFLKSLFLLIINSILVLFFLLILVIYSFLNIH